MTKDANWIECHRTHCCLLHGCKYNNEDCPVMNGSVRQSGVCEDCMENEDIRTVEELEAVIQIQGTPEEEKREAILWGVRGISEYRRYCCGDDKAWEKADRMLNYLRSLMKKEGLSFSKDA